MNQERTATATVLIVTFGAYIALQYNWLNLTPDSFSSMQTLAAAFLIGALSLYFVSIVVDLAEMVRDLLGETNR
jgi:hypothetical protein